MFGPVCFLDTSPRDDPETVPGNVGMDKGPDTTVVGSLGEVSSGPVTTPIEPHVTFRVWRLRL